MIKWKENCALIFCFVLVKLKVKYVKAYDLRANHKVSNKKNPACTMPRKRTQLIYNKQIKLFDSCFALKTELKCVRFIVLKDNIYCLNGVSLLQTDNLGMKKKQ